MGVQVRSVEIRSAGEIDSAIAGIPKLGVQAVVVIGSTLFIANITQVVAAIGKLQKPAIFPSSGMADAGGFMSYGANTLAEFRRAAYFVDRILRGTKPGDIPIEQPTEFELVVNLKTAKALGITIPQSILLQATKVLE